MLVSTIKQTEIDWTPTTKAYHHRTQHNDEN
jgi:hypothetical protein